MDKSVTIPKGELLTVEALRALAAISIVFFHAMIYANSYLLRYGLEPVTTDRDQWHEWLAASPVDLFFVISGFVLYRLVTSRPINPGQFFYLRASRIAGLYWILSLAFLVVFGWLGSHHYSFEYVLKSLLLIPVSNDQGFPTPLVFVAWTLTYEIIFYLSLTLATIFRNRFPVFLTSSLLLIALYSLALVAPEHWFTLNRLGEEVVLNFIIGMLLAIGLSRYKIGRGSGATFLVLGVILWLQQSFTLGHRLIDGAIPAALILAGSIAFETDIRRSAVGKLIKHLGNSTYSIYLIQVFSIPLAYHILGKSGVLQHAPFSVILALVTAFSIACGVVTYYGFEIRINASRKRLWEWINFRSKAT